MYNTDMKCQILHESSHRMRVHLLSLRLTMEKASILEQYLVQSAGIRKASVNERTGNAVVFFDNRAAAVSALAAFSFEDTAIEPMDLSARKINARYEEQMYRHILRRIAARLFLPAPVRTILNFIRAVPYFSDGIRALFSGRPDVTILDGASLAMALYTKHTDMAGSILFLLGFSQILEEWNYRKAVDELARAMDLHVDHVWVRNEDGTETFMRVKDLKPHDRMVVRTSSVIPLDGIVVDGEMRVMQKSVAGDNMAVYKEKGSHVFAGSVVKEGECLVAVKNTQGISRYEKIMQVIEQSQMLKSETETNALKDAGKLVPLSLLASAAAWLMTGDVSRSLAVLSVDYACALRRSVPIAMLAAMRECIDAGMTVKGGRYLDDIARASVIVFDKTGTLTDAVPEVSAVYAFHGENEDDMLCLAACLEEHFPHAFASAVVKEAQQRGLDHEEEHADVEYILAHGLASGINGRRVVIGSHHFLFDDEGCTVAPEDMARFQNLPTDASRLYMAIDGILSAVICIHDPLRPETAQVIAALKESGLRTVMLTGDGHASAQSAAEAAGIDEFHAECMPDDKAMYIQKLHDAGETVILSASGIGDAVALHYADVGIVVSDGAALAKEIADISISEKSLSSLVMLRDISLALRGRIKGSYLAATGLNTLLITLAAAGLMPSSVSAFLHNSLTLVLCMRALTPLAENRLSA